MFSGYKLFCCCRRKFIIMCIYVVICAHFNNIYIWVYTMVIDICKWVLLKITKIYYYFLKIVPRGATCPLGPTGKPFLARKFDHPGLGYRASILGGESTLFFSPPLQNRLWCQLSLISSDYEGGGAFAREREATTHVHLMTRLRMPGALLSLPHMSSWRGTQTRGQFHIIFPSYAAASGFTGEYNLQSSHVLFNRQRL
jgi:hypothetical protein